jgi:hypothetical protein
MEARHHPRLMTLPQLISAKRKIGIAAAFYDPKSSSLKPFAANENMTATEFRQQLQKNLHIQLTDEELGAIVVYLDRDGSRTVPCDDFIKEFFALGKGEKYKISYRHKLESQRRENRIQQWRKRQAEQCARLTSSKIDTNFTDKDVSSALEKIAKVAFDYDKTKGGLEVSRFSYLQ